MLHNITHCYIACQKPVQGTPQGATHSDSVADQGQVTDAEQSKLGGAFGWGLPQLLDVAHWWRAEEPFVFACELDGIAVAYIVTGGGGVKTFAQYLSIVCLSVVRQSSLRRTRIGGVALQSAYQKLSPRFSTPSELVVKN